MHPRTAAGREIPQDIGLHGAITLTLTSKARSLHTMCMVPSEDRCREKRCYR